MSMTEEQRALWLLLVEIGGDRELFALHPNLGVAFEYGIEVLEAKGIIGPTGRLAEEYRK